MTQYYPIQVIALDKVAHQALDLAELSRFSEITKSDVEKHSSVLIDGHHHIFVVSELDDTVMVALQQELQQATEPIVLLPHGLQGSENVKQLLIDGVRVILASSDTLIAISLSQALGALELMFYGNDTEMEIAVDHKDIYEVLKRGTISEFYEGSGSSTTTTMMNVMNVPKSFHDVTSTYTMFELHEDLSLMEVSEAMELVEPLLPEGCDMIFATRNTQTNIKHVKITGMVSRYYDFVSSLQSDMNMAESYLDKVSVIVDAYAGDIITEEEVQLLAARNGLHMKDIKTIYHVAYTQPLETVQLLKMMQDGKNTEQKIEAIADVVIEGNVDIDIAEEIAVLEKLSIDEILSVIHHKREEEVK